MDKVNVTEVDAYSWDCPECGHYNCHDKYSELICEGCGKKFELGEVET